MFLESLSELTPPCDESLCPDCRYKDIPYSFNIHDNETNVFFIEHDIDKNNFCQLTDMCHEVELLYKEAKQNKYDEKKKKYIEENPSLFGWNHISAHTQKPDFKYTNEWKALVLDKSHFLFHFIRLICDHIVLHSLTPVNWNYIPNYFLLLRAVMPGIQEAILGNFSISTRYSSIIPMNSHLTATRCSLSLLNNHNLLNLFTIITFEPCSIYNINDVELCIHYMEIWFDKIRNKESIVGDDMDSAIFEIDHTSSNEPNSPRGVSLIKLIQKIFTKSNGFPFVEMIINEKMYHNTFAITDAILWVESLGIVNSDKEGQDVIDLLIQSEYVEKSIFYLYYS